MHEFAVLLGFDRDSEDAILSIQREVGEATGNTFISDNGMFPHISLSLFTSEHPEECARIVKDLASDGIDITIRLGSVGIFNTPLAVVNLLPVVTKELLVLHDDLIRRLSPYASDLHSYYLQPVWIPHCSAAINIEPDLLGVTVEAVCARFQPCDVQVAYISLAECCPYREYGRWPVGCKKEDRSAK
jgi:hypothetical protein